MKASIREKVGFAFLGILAWTCYLIETLLVKTGGWWDELFLIISTFCLSFISLTESELS